MSFVGPGDHTVAVLSPPIQKDNKLDKLVLTGFGQPNISELSEDNQEYDEGEVLYQSQEYIPISKSNLVKEDPTFAQPFPTTRLMTDRPSTGLTSQRKYDCVEENKNITNSIPISPPPLTTHPLATLSPRAAYISTTLSPKTNYLDTTSFPRAEYLDTNSSPRTDYIGTTPSPRANYLVEFDRYRYTDTDTDISVSVRVIFKPIPISPNSPISN